MSTTRTVAGRTVHAVGLGGMAVDEYAPQASRGVALEIFRHAARSGDILIDTADVYGLGRNEKLIGEALAAADKDRLLIATKAGCTRPGGRGWGTDGRPEHIREAARSSLKRLGIEIIDLYQLHAIDPEVPLEESLGAFKELQEEGLIRHIGVSNFGLDDLKRALEVVEIASVQNRFSLLRRGDEADLLPFLVERDIAYLPYFPLESGRLTDEVQLLELARQLDLTPARLALAWIVNRWPNAIPIPGTRNPDHYDDNFQAASVELSEETMGLLDGLF